ncbi:DUF4998 domain-containing protein [Niabella insulamsoli]|uniref:DUF4998 domain-containing protein n=1 Tax=Niabella insulamsoli TaxID=3144874 RepID=UPI0031FCDBF5
MNTQKKLMVWAVLFLLLGIIACTTEPDDFKSFLNNSEIKYPGRINNAFTRPGNGRIALGWNPSPDQSVSRYVVYWNSGADSLIVPATTHNPSDTIQAIINNLQEYTYSFFVYSFDEKGNRSIPTEITNARVYGSTYQNNLYNRPLDASPTGFDNGDISRLKINFLPPDTVNITTRIRYTNLDGIETDTFINPVENSIIIPDYKIGSHVTYQSYYTPNQRSIDTFTVNTIDTIPVATVMAIDKRLFRELSLYGDGQPWDGSYETSLRQIWDGATSPQGWQNCFHSNGSKTLPYPISFDLGATYNRLTTMEMIGRDCCHNPIDYEIWGSNSLTVPPVEGNSPGWSDQMAASGWTLLADVHRTDDGVAPYQSSLITNPPPIRYIRIRIKKVASGESQYSNITQVTFWNDYAQ